MVYRGYLISHGGRRRKNNEDNGYLNGIYRLEDSLFYWECSCEKRKSLLTAVFDGVGGEEKGEVASRIAALTLREYDGKDSVSEYFQDYVEKANRRILQDPCSERMASTCAILSIENDYYHFCNMGDSRGYLIRDDRIIQLTYDHNMVTQLLKKGVLTPEQAARHPDRHAIYQYLGMREEKSEYEIALSPCIAEPVRACKKDLCLLCTDGLTDMVSEQEILSITSQNKTLEDKTKQLLLAALDHGGRDNITMILLQAGKH